MSLRERRLSEGQYKAITQANKPTSVNPYATLADLPAAKPYKSYVALISQIENLPPVPIVLHNDFSEEPSFLYSGVGSYEMQTSGDLFPDGATTQIMQNGNSDGRTAIVWQDTNAFTIQSYDVTGSSLLNGQLVNTYLEVRVYDI